MRTSIAAQVGQVFGRLTTLDAGYLVQYKNSKNTCHMVRCECGTVKQVRRRSLISGRVVSCGCYHKEVTAGINKSHGHSKGRKKTPEYRAYSNMLDRCYNPNNKRYPSYGGRGISVFPEWLGPGGFERWFAYVGPRPNSDMSLERDKVNGNYEPGNCRWATDEDQQNNKRNSHLVTHLGRTQTMQQWSEEVGIKYSTLRYRIRQGWPPERAFSQPVRPRTTTNQPR